MKERRLADNRKAKLSSQTAITIGSKY